MPAEVVCDAVLQSTASTTSLEEFQNRLQDRTIAIAGTQPPGNLRSRQFALEVFGRSTRETNCDCDRSDEASLLQTVYLQNDQDIYQVLKRADGWLNEVAGVRPVQAAAGQDQQARQATAIRNRLGQVARQIEHATEQNREELVRKLKRQQANLRQRLRKIEPDEPEPEEERPANENAENAETDELITEAYLRTLSRFPSLDERTRCQAYLQDAGSLGQGLEGLMWALINTKEFRIIH